VLPPVTRFNFLPVLRCDSASSSRTTSVTSVYDILTLSSPAQQFPRRTERDTRSRLPIMGIGRFVEGIPIPEYCRRLACSDERISIGCQWSAIWRASVRAADTDRYHHTPSLKAVLVSTPFLTYHHHSPRGTDPESMASVLG
jgi:hypothetical protein